MATMCISNSGLSVKTPFDNNVNNTALATI